MTLRQKRHHEVTNTLNRAIAQRDGCLANLVRYELKIRDLKKQALRLERAMAKPVTAKPKPVPQAAAPAPAPISDVTDISWSEITGADLRKDDDPIPAFLDRTTKSAKERDRIAAETIRAQAAERKKTRSRNRIEEMKAKQSGATKRMPLTGKAALQFIQQ